MLKLICEEYPSLILVNFCSYPSPSLLDYIISGADQGEDGYIAIYPPFTCLFVKDTIYMGVGLAWLLGPIPHGGRGLGTRLEQIYLSLLSSHLHHLYITNLGHSATPHLWAHALYLLHLPPGSSIDPSLILVFSCLCASLARILVSGHSLYNA